MKKYIFLNDSCDERNLAKGSLALQYNTKNKVLSVVDGVNGEIVNNLTNESLKDYAKISSIPTKVSELKNDSKFITSKDIPDLSPYATKEELNEEISKINSCTWEICGKLNSEEELNIKTPTQGHIWLVGDKEYLGDGEKWIELGVSIELSGYATKEELNDYAKINQIPEVPTKLSDLDQDISYLTEHQDLSEYAKKSELFSRNYEDLSGKPDLNQYLTTESDPVFAAQSGSFRLKTDKIEYNDLNGAPSIPSKTSELTNDSGFLTEHQDLSNYALKSDLPEIPSSIATLEDIPNGIAELEEKSYNSLTDKPIFGKGEINAIQNKLEYLEKQLDKLLIPSSTIIMVDDPTNLSQPNKDLYIEINAPISGQVTNVNGNSIIVKKLSVDNGRLNVVAENDVNFSNLTTDGNLPKATSNAQVSINTSDYVKITDSNINQTSYNAIEIGLTASSAPKSVFIDNLNFDGELSNNAILIFNTADNAVVNISNSTFRKFSNAIRISNRDNVHVTVNLINCEFGEWDSIPEYAGIVICEDYTSKSVAAEQTNNLFAPDKVTINFINCTHNHEKIIFNSREEIAGTKNVENVESQLVYVYNDYEGYINYNANRYPTITCS